MTPSKRYMAKKAFYAFQKGISAVIWPFCRFNGSVFPKRQARILMYHNTSNLPREKNIPYDNVPPKLFRRHMAILAREHYNVISLDTLLEIMGKKQEIPVKTIVITFDDGYKNNYFNAFPILNDVGFGATFFLIADAMGMEKPFHHLLWDKRCRRQFLSDPDSRFPLDWREIRELARCGMDIGSHGLTHKSIGYLEPKAARMEIVHSREILENALSKRVRHFSYPFGSRSYGDFNIFTHGILRDAGYESACITEIGAIGKNDPVYELKRIPIRETDTPISFKQKISGAFDWVQICKSGFQRNAKRIDRVNW